MTNRPTHYIHQTIEACKDSATIWVTEPQYTATLKHIHTNNKQQTKHITNRQTDRQTNSDRTNDFTVCVDSRATAVARVNGGINLEIHARTYIHTDINERRSVRNKRIKIHM